MTHLHRALEIQRQEVVALVGAGGKTTALAVLRRELLEAGWRVAVTATTRLWREQAGALEAVVLPGLEGQKALGIAPEEVAGLLEGADAVLVEADGARGRAFKAPAEHEPALPPSATLVVIVAGAEALGAPLGPETVHRPERVAELTGLAPGEPLSPQAAAWVMTHPLGGLKSVPAEARVAVLINKVEDDERRAAARELARELLETPRIERVALTALQAPEPVVELYVNEAAER